jgi:hypothetical protein
MEMQTAGRAEWRLEEKPPAAGKPKKTTARHQVLQWGVDCAAVLVPEEEVH